MHANKPYLGIDGGGTKTMFTLMDAEGAVLAQKQYGTASYKEIGLRGVADMIRGGIAALPEKPGHVCIGMPMFGENAAFEAAIQKEFPNYLIVNDSEVGWAGSLGIEPGINIVAGTGSIAFGKNADGARARCGGWTELFSDEGSGYWLGRRTVELFTKQADFRIERGALYEITREFFNSHDDFEIITKIEDEYQPHRDKVASLQMLLLKAASAGDVSAAGMYADAARELAEIVKGAWRQLGKPAGCKVSWSGGVFKAGDFLTRPFRDALAGFEIVAPLYPPDIGAVLLAAESAGPGCAKKLLEKLGARAQLG